MALNKCTTVSMTNPNLRDTQNKIIVGSAEDVLATLGNDFVDCIVTSPPYYGQRDYGHSGQIGDEKTPELYIESLRRIFQQAHRVLKPSGTLWLNLGDKYLKSEMLGLPWRVALALQSDGWRLRSDIVWHKPNAMPSAVKNRPTTDHEYVFLLAKSDNYYYDADSIREPHVTFSENSKMRGGRRHLVETGTTPEKGKNAGSSNLHSGSWDKAFHEAGRNKRTVWNIALSKFRGAHFAVFPEKLVEPCVLAGCPEGGLVLDPFIGSGTTGVVATRLRRHYLGIEINAEYAAIAERRISAVELPLF